MITNLPQESQCNAQLSLTTMQYFQEIFLLMAVLMTETTTELYSAVLTWIIKTFKENNEHMNSSQHWIVVRSLWEVFEDAFLV